MTNCVALLDKALASRRFSDLFDQKDKDGLISMKLLRGYTQEFSKKTAFFSLLIPTSDVRSPGLIPLTRNS